MSELEPRGPDKLPKPTGAQRAAVRIHATEQAATIAKRIKDASSLEKALLEKLEGQRDFSAEYRGKFPHGGLRDQDASTGALPQGADWCLSHGFTPGDSGDTGMAMGPLVVVQGHGVGLETAPTWGSFSVSCAEPDHYVPWWDTVKWGLARGCRNGPLIPMVGKSLTRVSPAGAGTDAGGTASERRADRAVAWGA